MTAIADDYCVDCRAPLREPLARNFGICLPCMDKWTALAVVGTPSRIHPKDAAREAAHGYDPEREIRQDAAEDGDKAICPECKAPLGWGDIFVAADSNAVRFDCALCNAEGVLP